MVLMKFDNKKVCTIIEKRNVGSMVMGNYISIQLSVTVNILDLGYF